MRKYLLFILLILLSCAKKVEKEQKEIVPEKNEKTIEASEDVKQVDSLSIVKPLPDLVEVETVHYDVLDSLIDSLRKAPPKHIHTGFTEGIYLSAYTVNSKWFKPILAKADSAGMNTVVFDLKNMNGAVFSKDLQKSSLLDYEFIPIIDVPALVDTLHSHKMKAVARLVMFHDINLASNYDSLRPKSKAGGAWLESKRRDPSWLDSSNPTVQKSLLHLIEQTAQQGVDEIQLDYVRFPTQGNLSNAFFHFMKEDSLNALQDSTYVKREKRHIIYDFLKRARAICDVYDVRVTTDVFAIAAWQRKVDVGNTGQDFTLMGEHAHAIHPMIYTSHFAKGFGGRKDVYNEPYQILFQGTLLSKEAAGERCEVIPYIQANAWRVKYKKEYIDAQIKAIKDAGGSGYILWNAQNRYSKTLTWITEIRAFDQYRKQIGKVNKTEKKYIPTGDKSLSN